VLRYDGAAWTQLDPATGQQAWWVYGVEVGPVFVVGDAGSIARYVDGTWEQMATDLPGVTLYGVWGATPDDVWAVGANGRTVHWDGQKWNLIDSNFPITLRGLYGLAADDMWAVGNEGTILHFDGDAWTPWSSGSVATFYEIDGDGEDHVVIVGDLGSIYTLRSEESEIEDE
jgi:hypothetical protein